MRILHTSDWHLGKRLGRYDRTEEQAAVLDEIAGVADDEAAELVLVSGDLFDRPYPPVETLRLGLETLTRLARGGQRPVVAIAGNHDSPELLELLAPLLAGRGVHLVGAVRRPDKGGVLELQPARGGPRALVACLPFVREGRVVDFLAEADSWYGSYADRLARLCAAYDAHLTARAAAGPPAVTLLCAHFLISGVKLGGHGLPRGERELHMGEAYSASEQALPPSVQYVALGHVHAPQPAPGSPVPAEYAGSPLELDFGEAGERKRVVIVDLDPGLPARCRGVALTAGRRLVRASGRFEDLLARKELAEVFADLTVLTDGPDPGLADRARQAFPYLVRVRAEYGGDGDEDQGRPDRTRPWDELYAGYYRAAHEGIEPPDTLMAAFRELLDEVDEHDGVDADDAGLGGS